jgi:predicted RNA-binding Zn ribbon-like protein
MPPRDRAYGQGMGPLLGGLIAVDFANADGLTASLGAEDYGWGGLVEFLKRAGTITAVRGERLRELPLVAPEETAGLLRLAISLRDAMRHILGARVAGRALDPDWIAQINAVLACTEGYERLEAAGDAGARADWQLRLAARSEGLEWLLAAVARSAAELIAQGPAAPVRKCANPKCGLYFYDDSRTGRRRWCSMATCGNRAKVAAHFRRNRAAR